LPLMLDILDEVIWELELKQYEDLLQATNSYKDELKSIYEVWAEDYLRDLEIVPEDGRREYIAAALLLLGRQLKERQRIKLVEAFNLGLAGDPPSPQSLVNLSNHIIEQEKYVDTSLLPDLETYLLELEEPTKESLLKRAYRVGLYAGAFWAATQLAQIWISQDDRKVTWISRDDGGTCKQCHSLHRKTFTVATLPATPGVDVECDGNCRCYLVFEGVAELWPYQGNP
jgi:hypothetical protein